MTDWQKEALKCQTEWSRILQSWKYFENEDDLVKTYLGICLFGFVESDKINNLSLSTYHNNYSKSQHNIIDKIFAHLLSLSGHVVELGHTFLYLNENSIVYCVFRFRTQKYVYFIEPSGRVYNSWIHFLETNELPPCEFLAPENGVYKKNCKIVRYKTSDTKKWLNKSQTVMDWVCGIAGVGCTILGIFSVAPGVLAGTAIAVGFRNMHKSIANILDNQEHRQLSTLSSVSGTLSLASIAASALSGVSKTYEMISLVGEHGSLSLKVLHSLNLTGRLIDDGYFGTYLLHLNYIMQKGEISNVDALELAGQIFILYGAVVDVQRLHFVITRQVVNSRVDLAVKFNDWKFKLSKNGCRVKKCEPLIGLKLLANRCKNPLQILSKFYSRSDLVLNTCFDSENFTLDYLCDKITLNQFCVEIRPLFLNLWTLFNKDCQEIEFIVRYYVNPVINNKISQNDVKDLCKLLNEAICGIKQMDRVPDLEKVEKLVETEKSPDLVDKAMDVVSETETDNYKVILDAAKSLINKKNVYSSIEHVIISCHNSILFTTNKLTEILSESYNSIVAFNRDIVGEERLQIILERIQAKTLDDYFHHDAAFSNAINKFKKENELLPDHELVLPGLRPLNPEEIREIINETTQLYEKAYSSATHSAKLSLSDTMTMLQNVSSHWNEKLISRLNEPRPVMRPKVTPANTYAQLNATLEIMASGDSADMGIFRHVIRGVQNDNKIVPISQSLDIFTPAIQTKPINRTNTQLCESLLIICCNFYQKVIENFNDESSNKIFILRKVFHFTISKFFEIMEDLKTTCTSSTEKHCESNQMFLIFDQSECRFYNLLQNHYDQLNDEFSQYLFDEWSYDKIEVWKKIIDSNEFNLRVINSPKQETDEYYKSVASKLFGIVINDEYDIVINVNSIFLKSLKKFIIFNYVSDCDVIVTALNLKLNI